MEPSITEAKNKGVQETNSITRQTGCLENELIVSRILSFLAAEELKACRQVNKLWNREAIPFLSHKQWCHYTPQLFPLIKSSEQFPFNKFGLRGTKGGRQKQLLQRKFIQAISGFVKEFLIDNSNHKLGEQSEALLPLTLVYPNLTRLLIAGIVPWHENANVQEFIAAVIRHSPELQRLLLFGYYNTNAISFYINAMDCANGKQITRLLISGVFRDAHFSRLANMGLQLTTLELGFYRMPELTDTGKEHLTRFLKSQANTLKILAIGSVRMRKVDPEFAVNLPILPHVETLMIGKIHRERSAIYKICFATQLPALKNLIISVDDNLDQLFSCEMKPFETLECLKLPEVLNNVDVVRKAAQQFPRVRQLTVPARVNVLQTVFESFENVKELTLQVSYSVYFVEEALTGYTSEEIRVIRRLPQRLKQLVETHTEPVPFLHRLEFLKIEGSMTNYKAILFSDFTCRSIVRKLKALKHLDLLDTDCARISASLLQEIGGKISVYCRPESITQYDVLNLSALP